MHEIGIIKDIIESVRRQISSEKDIKKISRINIQLGNSAYVSRESLSFWFENMSLGTELEGASLEFQVVKGNKIVVDSIEERD